MPRLCFLVLSHTEPDLVERLVRVITTELPDACAVVRHDARTVPFEAARVADLPHVHVRAHREDATWGSWALTARTLEGVQHALELEEPWDWLVLVSGQSYPIAPLTGFAERLARTPGDALLHLAPPAEHSRPSWWRWLPEGADRARYRFHRLPWTPLWELHHVRHPLVHHSRRQPLVTFFFHRDPQRPQRVVAHVARLAGRSVLTGGVTPVKASQWWAARREAAASLLTLLDRRSRWHRHFRHTFTSDELAVPSLLTAGGFAVQDQALHALWWPRGPSPATLTRENLPWLEERPEPFTRKVSLSDGGALVEALDAMRARRAAREETGDRVG